MSDKLAHVERLLRIMIVLTVLLLASQIGLLAALRRIDDQVLAISDRVQAIAAR